MLRGLAVPLVWAACVHLAAWAVGRRAYEALTRGGARPSRDRSRAVVSAALGFAILANGALLLGLARALWPPLVVGAVGTLACLGARAAASSARALRPRAAALRPALDDAPLLLAVAFTATFLPNALHPDLAHDDNVYHLLLPRLYLDARALRAVPANLFANMPHLVEVLHAVSMAVGDFSAAKVTEFGIAFWTIAGIAAFAYDRVGRLGAGIAALLFVSGKNVQWHFGLAHAEPVIGFFLLAGALAFVSWRETANPGEIVVVGVMAGSALASKYSAWGFALALLAAALAALALSRGPARPRLRAAAAAVAPAAALLAPWLVKNAVVTGNPIYPNLYGLFGGRWWSAIQESHLLRSMADAGGARKTVGGALLLPWRLVTDDGLFHCRTASIALMALFVAAVVRPASWRAASLRAPEGALPAIALGGFVAWGATVQQGRFLVAWVPPMALAASLALAPLAGRRRALAAVAVGVVAAGAFQLAAQRDPYAPRIEVFARSRASLLPLNRNYSICEYLNEAVSPDAKVLAMWDNRFFFLKREFLGDSAYEAPSSLAWLRALDDPAAFARALAAAGVTHVVLNTRVARLYLDNQIGIDLVDGAVYTRERLRRDRELFADFVSDTYLERVAESGTVVVLRLRESPHGS
jgi:hypothetical protein